MTTPPRDERVASLGFVIEQRGKSRCIVESGGGVRPASSHECAMWDALTTPADEGEPIGYLDVEEMRRHKSEGGGGGIICGNYSERYRRTTPVYLHPAAQVKVPDGLRDDSALQTGTYGNGYARGWNACRAATLRLNQPAGEVGGWRGIESAPRDGTRVLVGNDHGSWFAEYRSLAPSGFKFDNPWRSMMLNHDHILREYRDLPPTHWQPIPPPAREGEQP